MSVLRIPFSASIIWAVYTCMTAPQPPAEANELIGPIGLEVQIMPIMIKAFFWVLGLVEILVILSNIDPSIGLSKFVAESLVRPTSNPDLIRITWHFMLAWICCLSGALIRRSCYRALGAMFTFEISLQKSHQLVTSGPYAYVRHPSYSSGALALFGALVCHTTPGAWALECSGIFQPLSTRYLLLFSWLLPCLVFYTFIVPRLDREDGLLKARFGLQWERWACKVPFKLIPSIY